MGHLSTILYWWSWIYFFSSYSKVKFFVYLLVSISKDNYFCFPTIYWLLVAADPMTKMCQVMIIILFIILFANFLSNFSMSRRLVSSAKWCTEQFTLLCLGRWYEVEIAMTLGLNLMEQHGLLRVFLSYIF